MMFPLNPLCIRLSLDRLCEYLYFDGYPNLNIALINGTIDAFLGDEPALKSIHAEQPQIDYIKERLTNNKYSFAFRKDDEKEKKLCDQLNSFLAKANSDGTIAEIDSIWFGTDDSKKVVDMSDLTGENGTIHVITTTTNEIFNSPKKKKTRVFIKVSDSFLLRSRAPILTISHILHSLKCSAKRILLMIRLSEIFCLCLKRLSNEVSLQGRMFS